MPRVCRLNRLDFCQRQACAGSRLLPAYVQTAAAAAAAVLCCCKSWILRKKGDFLTSLSLTHVVYLLSLLDTLQKLVDSFNPAGVLKGTALQAGLSLAVPAQAVLTFTK